MIKGPYLQLDSGEEPVSLCQKKEDELFRNLIEVEIRNYYADGFEWGESAKSLPGHGGQVGAEVPVLQQGPHLLQEGPWQAGQRPD